MTEEEQLEYLEFQKKKIQKKMDQIAKLQAKKPRNKNEDSQSSCSASSSSSESRSKKKQRPAKRQGEKQKDLLPTQVDQLLPESMVIDNKVTGETKKKPPRDYSPEDGESEETPEEAVVLEEAGKKSDKISKGQQNLKEAIKQDEKELKKQRKKDAEAKTNPST